MVNGVSNLQWMLRVQRDLLRAAWHGRRSVITRHSMIRWGHDLWAHTASNKLPVKSLWELFPGIRCDVRLRFSPFEAMYRSYRLYTHHVCVLASLVAYLRPKRIFEFGTYRGEMTANLALNAPEDCRIFTLDLPPGQATTRLQATQADLHLAQTRHFLEFESLPEIAARITPLYCDSAEFHSESYASSFDFIFVDGAHSYEYVANDSRHAFGMLRPGGVIVWDDYGFYGKHWEGVARYLQEEAQRRPIFHLEDTRLALYQDQRGD